MKTFVECLSGFTTSDQRRLVLSWPGAFLQPAPEDTNQVEVALGNISQSRGGRGYYVFVTILHQTLQRGCVGETAGIRRTGPWLGALEQPTRGLDSAQARSSVFQLPAFEEFCNPTRPSWPQTERSLSDLLQLDSASRVLDCCVCAENAQLVLNR